MRIPFKTMPVTRQAGRAIRAVLVAALAAAAACQEATDPGGEGDQAEVLLMHASAGTGAVSLEIGGVSVVHDVPYGRASSRVLVPAGAQTLTVRAGGSVLGTIAGQLSTAHVNTVVVANGAVALSADVAPDTGAVAPARANLRLVTVAAESNAAPTDLQALLSRQASGDTVQRFRFDATVARYGSLLYYDPGHFTVRYVPNGTESPVLAQAEFDVAAGQAKALVLSRGPGGDYQVVVVEEP
ncbi:MAG: hypothetical protein R2882_12825 [Gemmatimonadales bacterium]